jgi:hypothetical protein
MRPEIAVMVSGNAMAHLYVDVAARQRSFWPNMSERQRSLVGRLMELASVDLAILPDVSGATIRTRSRGDAYIAEQDGRFSYRRSTGDPLGIGRDVERATANESHELTLGTEYPDSVVQIARLAQAPRAGEIILSAAHDWDFRSKHEPIPHVSCHGALCREHMIVPLLSNRRYATAARRTTDLMPSALAALGRTVPSGLDGESFI